jgi:hypothetical protein
MIPPYCQAEPVEALFTNDYHCHPELVEAPFNSKTICYAELLEPPFAPPTHGKNEFVEALSWRVSCIRPIVTLSLLKSHPRQKSTVTLSLACPEE